MTNYYSNSADYHNDLDAFEARIRAEQAERDLDEAEKPRCACYEYIGDNPECPIHGDYFKKADEQERADLYTMGMGR